MSRQVYDIVLAECALTGHRRAYLDELARAALSLGARVAMLVPEGEVGAVRTDFPQLSVEAIGYDESTGRRERWGKLSTRLRELGWRPGVVYIPFVDKYLYLDGGRFPAYQLWRHDRLMPYPWAGLYFHPTTNPGRASERLFGARNCRAVHVLDERYLDELDRAARRQVASPFPDFTYQGVADTEHPLEGWLAQAPRPTIALLGSLDRRKGLPTLLDLHQLATGQGRQLGVLAAGQWHAHTFSPAEQGRIRALADTPPPGLLLHLERIDGGEGAFNRIVRAADIIYIGYEQFEHSSNLLTKAIAAGKPVLASDQGLVAARVREYRAGALFSPGDPASALKALESLSTWQPDATLTARYLSIHSPAALKTLLEGLIRNL